MKELGVTRVLGPNASGSLQPHVKPGDFVVCDQLVDRTRSRPNTFYDGPITTHISFADPYCPELRALAPGPLEQSGSTVHPTGTVVVIQGPRFSTKAESKWFGEMGWDVVNMTQYPEAYLTRELGMCYLGIALVTDYDVGVPDVGETSSVAEIIEVFEANIGQLRRALHELVAAIPSARTCSCSDAAREGRVASPRAPSPHETSERCG
jgi:5'-methylthioadenosine phosphorylase